MKIIIHSNGNPFTLKGGYAEQIRYLFRMFHEEGHDVYFFNTGMLRDENQTKVYNFAEILKVLKVTPDKYLPDTCLDILKNIQYLCHSNVGSLSPHFIHISKVNEFIDLVKADHFFTLCDVILFEKDAVKLNCPSTAWWPCHYNPPDQKSLSILPYFNNIITLSPCIQNILSNYNLKSTTCPHVIKTINYQPTSNNRLIRERFEIPINSYVCLINAVNTEKSNRKSFDTAFLAFKKYLEINPNAFLYINSPTMKATDELVEFQYPVGHVKDTPLVLNHPKYGEITVSTAGKNYVENNSYKTSITVNVPFNKPSINLIELLAQLEIPVERFKFNNVVISHQDLKDLYHTSDVLLACSRSEGFGLPILEAQVMGLPVVTTKFLAMQNYTYYGISVTPCQLVLNPAQMGLWAMPDSEGIARAIDTINKWDYETKQDKFTNAKFIIENSMSYGAVKTKLMEIVHLPKPEQKFGLEVRDLLQIADISELQLIGQLDNLKLEMDGQIKVITHHKQTDSQLANFKTANPMSQVVSYEKYQGTTPCGVIYINDPEFSFNYLADIEKLYHRDTIFVMENIREEVFIKLCEFIKEGKIKLIGRVTSRTKRLVFRILEDITGEYRSYRVEQAYCFVDDEKILADQLSRYRYDFPIYEFIPVGHEELVSLDNWKQNLINEGLLNPLALNLSPLEIAEWISHRALWTHLVKNNIKGALVILNVQTIAKSLPDKIQNKKMLAYYQDRETLDSYYITKETAEELLPVTTPFKINLTKFIMLYLNNRNNGTIYFNYEGILPDVNDEVTNEVTNEVTSLDTTVTETTGTETSETETTGTETSETDITGTETSETETAGTETSQTNTEGTETSVTETSETDITGTETSVTDLTGTETSETDTSVTKTSETEKIISPPDIVINNENTPPLESHLDTDTGNETVDTESVVIDIKKSDNEIALRAQNKSKHTPKIAIITTVINKVYYHLMENCLRSKQAYCDKHGYDLIIGGQEQLEKGDSPLWVKYRLIQRYLPKYDYVFYSDADVLIMNDTIVLEDIIKEYMEEKDNILVSVDTHSNIGTNVNRLCLNTSNFFVKNDIWSLAFLENVYNQLIFRKHSLADQGAFNHLFYEEAENRENIKIIPNFKIFNSIFPLPNAEVNLQFYTNNDFLLHYQKWKTPYLTNLHTSQLSFFNYKYQHPSDEVFSDEKLEQCYQVKEPSHKLRIITFFKNFKELQNAKLLIQENSRVARKYGFDYYYEVINKNPIVDTKADTKSPTNTETTTDTDSETVTETTTETSSETVTETSSETVTETTTDTSSETTSNQTIPITHPYESIKKSLQEEPDITLVIISSTTLLTNNAIHLQNYISPLLKDHDLVVGTGKRVISFENVNNISLSLSNFAVKSSSWSIKLFTSFILDKSNPSEFFSELFYTNQEVFNHTKLIYSNRLLKAGLFSERETDIIYDVYHGRDAFIDFSGFNELTRNYLISLYININIHREPCSLNTYPDDFITKDNRSITKLYNDYLCQVTKGETQRDMEWLVDSDGNGFIIDILPNKELGLTKKLVPFRLKTPEEIKKSNV